MDVERAGGRGANQLRPIDCARDVLSRAHGSASCSHGETRVLAAVLGPKAGTKKNENPEKACIEVIWKAKTGPIGKTEKEFEMILKRTLQNIRLLTVHPNTTTSIIVQVVHDDGYVLPCAIHASCAALVDAGIPLKSLAVSLCCCLTESGNIILDPSKLEEQKMKAFVCLVFPSSVHSILPEESTHGSSKSTEQEIITSLTHGVMTGLAVCFSEALLSTTTEYIDGIFTIQRASSFLPLMALDPQKNEKIAEMWLKLMT